MVKIETKVCGHCSLSWKPRRDRKRIEKNSKQIGKGWSSFFLSVCYPFTTLLRSHPFHILSQLTAQELISSQSLNLWFDKTCLICILFLRHVTFKRTGHNQNPNLYFLAPAQRNWIQPILLSFKSPFRSNCALWSQLGLEYECASSSLGHGFGSSGSRDIWKPHPDPGKNTGSVSSTTRLAWLGGLWHIKNPSQSISLENGYKTSIGVSMALNRVETPEIFISLS